MAWRNVLNVKKLTKQKESETLEFKASSGEWKEIVETVSAFANTRGGKIIIGVSKSGKLLGLQIGKDTIERLTNQISQNTDPKIHPHTDVEKVDGKSIIIVGVRESPDHLVLAFGRPYKRVGRSTVRMSKDGYEGLILEKHKDKIQFDTQSCKGALLKDIDSGKVKLFLEKTKEERRLTIPEKVSTREALEYLKVLCDGKLDNTAILLFGKDPQKYFVQAKIRAGRIKGTEGHDFLDMKVLEGTIPELREKSMMFINEHIKKAVFLMQIDATINGNIR